MTHPDDDWRHLPRRAPTPTGPETFPRDIPGKVRAAQVIRLRRASADFRAALRAGDLTAARRALAVGVRAWENASQGERDASRR
jgi:hypothetical protein